MKIHIATSRSIGLRCIEMANEPGLSSAVWELVDNPDDCEVFISVMYEHLVSEQFINKPGRRCYNFHPGILPQYRGSGAFSWVIINGEKECGITLHELDVNIDTGPVIDIHRFNVDAWDTAKSLYDKGMVEIEIMFHKWFRRLVDNEYQSTPQFEAAAHTYYRKDLEKVLDLTRYVRAFTYEGKPSSFYTTKDGTKCILGWYQ